jgi:transposase
MAILTVGIDLAKNVFALHGVNEAGKPELLPRVARAKLRFVPVKTVDLNRPGI